MLTGDGELDEDSNHEAIALAGRLGLDRLTAVVIDNGTSSLGRPGGSASRTGRRPQWTDETTRPSTSHCRRTQRDADRSRGDGGEWRMKQGDTGEEGAMRVVFAEIVKEELRNNPNLAVVTADISATAFDKARAQYPTGWSTSTSASTSRSRPAATPKPSRSRPDSPRSGTAATAW